MTLFCPLLNLEIGCTSAARWCHYCAAGEGKWFLERVKKLKRLEIDKNE